MCVDFIYRNSRFTYYYYYFLLLFFKNEKATLTLQLIRLISSKWNQIYLETFKGILRPHELDSLFPGATHF